MSSFNIEKDLDLYEIKGLLKGLERKLYRLRYDIAVDNMHDLNNEIPKMRTILDRIESKLTTYNDEDDGELI